MRLLLIRHGQTPNNVAGALDTAYPGAGLTPLGNVQAAAIPRVLADESIGGIYASVLTRTQLTAAPLARATDVGIQIIDGVHEIPAGDFEMRNDHEAVGAYVGALRRWSEGDMAFALSGGESGHDFFARYDAAIDRVASENADGTAVVVSHGAAIRVWAAGRAINVEPQQAVQRGLHNTGLFALEGDPERGWTLVNWHEEPLGGLDLEDPAAHDVTGETAAESTA
ncbi:histidine phosphatase [Microbacterium sp. CH12i]|uniref:histidine phosphatase family protein n=1 Tax=Microbacterium sp. CH12i TaxID=1479651 RepID=UPI000460D0E1|nr:histidine phosphatase family protein [Microbacterium sp. CH12i]KDA06238.1 histidine phosphatase [Microbacterium sp. CH12i]